MLINIVCFAVGYIISYVTNALMARKHMRNVIAEIKTAVLAGSLKCATRLEALIKIIEKAYYL